MTERVYPGEASATVIASDSKVLPRRNGGRGMLPSSWTGRTLRVEYTDAHGHGQSTTAALLDWCAVGPVLGIGGARTVIGWDRLVLCDLWRTNEHGG